jgi:hypothetical protein
MNSHGQYAYPNGLVLLLLLRRVVAAAVVEVYPTIVAAVADE